MKEEKKTIKELTEEFRDWASQYVDMPPSSNTEHKEA